MCRGEGVVTAGDVAHDDRAVMKSRCHRSFPSSDSCGSIGLCAIAAELTLHATEELGHATLLTGRIIQLGGTPVVDPKDWFALSPCAYDAPADPYVSVVLDQNIAGEQCAITVYNQLMKATKDMDMVTYNLALTILEQEVEHEEDLQSLKEDLELMVTRGSR